MLGARNYTVKPSIVYQRIRRGAFLLYVAAFWVGAMALLIGGARPSQAQENAIPQICPARRTITARGGTFTPGGIILTTFDRSAIWVYNVDSNRRYPLPETTPCGRGCRLSPDARWVVYFNRLTQAYNRMRLDGTERSLVAQSASDVEWWGDNTFLVWTTAQGAFVQVDGAAQQILDVRGISSIQPNGSWALEVMHDGDGFTRQLVNLANPDDYTFLGVDMAYFNAQSWSPDGSRFAYVAPIDPTTPAGGAELYVTTPDVRPTEPLTHLYDTYGAVRINGQSVGELSWSPDSTRIAFWVTPQIGDDPTATTGEATIHIVDTATGETRAYCGFSTIEHTPNPPRLVWSPDGTTIAFGGNVEGDDKGYLLLALNVESGEITELSEGIYPALGAADVITWGLPPR